MANSNLKGELNEISGRLDRQVEITNGLMDQQKKEGLTKETVPVITSQQLKEQVGALMELTTQKYIYTNADERSTEETWIFGWTLPFSSNKLLITYDGTIKAGVDLSEASIEVDEGEHLISIVLPPSKILDHNIPQDKISVVEIRDGLFNKVTIDDFNQFVSEQKVVMEEKAIGMGLLEEADKEAQSILKAFLEVLPGMDNYQLDISIRK